MEGEERLAQVLRRLQVLQHPRQKEVGVAVRRRVLVRGAACLVIEDDDFLDL